MATAAVASNSEASNVTPTSGGKRLVKSKSGLKIVCQHDRESAPWDMAEPQWTPDKEVDLQNCGVGQKFIPLSSLIPLK